MKKYGKRKTEIFLCKKSDKPKKGFEIIARLDRTKPRAGATLMDGYVAGYKSKYVVVSSVKIRGWKQIKSW